MRDIFGTVGKVMGYIFAALLIGYTSWLTFLLAGRLIPDQLFLQIMTLVLFDAAALIWFTTFITVAKGTLQWAIAGIGFVIGLIGTVIMAGGELILGQQLVVVEDPDRIGWILIATLVVAALVHVTLIYLFHFTDPHLMNRIETSQKIGKAISQAGQDARSEIERNMPELTARLVDSILDEAQQQIGLATAWHIRRAGHLQAHAGEIQRGGPVVDGSARDVPDDEPPPAPPRSRNPLAGMVGRIRGEPDNGAGGPRSEQPEPVEHRIGFTPPKSEHRPEPRPAPMPAWEMRQEPTFTRPTEEPPKRKRISETPILIDRLDAAFPGLIERVTTHERWNREHAILHHSIRGGGVKPGTDVPGDVFVENTMTNLGDSLDWLNSAYPNWRPKARMIAREVMEEVRRQEGNPT